MDPVGEIREALGAELLRSRLLGRELPRLVNRYDLARILGCGANGIVAEAVDATLNRRVALKIVPTVVGGSPGTKEARALAQVKHRNVIVVHDALEPVRVWLNGREFTVWIVSMEYIEGARSIRSWLTETKRRPRDILGVFVEAARGLAAAHETNIVHRDFKPDNVVVGSDGVPKVLDFGLAIQVSADHTLAGTARSVAGTDPYMSPEARAGRAIKRSDQYSFGVSLMEAFTEKVLPAGRRRPCRVPRYVWPVLVRATETDPAERYSDMPKLIVALEHALLWARFTDALTGVSLATGGAFTMVALLFVFPSSLIPLLPHMLDGSGAPPVPNAAHQSEIDAGTPDASAYRADSAADGALDPENIASDDGVRTSVDAGPIVCPAVSGIYHFRTVRTHGGRPGDATSAVYELVLEETRRRTAASLTRLQPRRDHLEVRTLERRPDCSIFIGAVAESRHYELRLSVLAGEVRGTFEAFGDAARPDFGGDVIPAAR